MQRAIRDVTVNYPGPLMFRCLIIVAALYTILIIQRNNCNLQFNCVRERACAHAAVSISIARAGVANIESFMLRGLIYRASGSS